MSGGGTVNLVFVLRRLDLENAFDQGPREVNSFALREKHVP